MRCGLLMARWPGFLAEIPSDPPVDAAWQVLLANWDDDLAHKRFLEKAAQHDGLDVAAALYREAQRKRPDDLRAAAALKRSVVLAQDLYAAKSLASRPPVATTLTRVIAIGVAVVLVCAALSIVYFVYHR